MPKDTRLNIPLQEIYEENNQNGEGEKDDQNRDEIKEEKDILRQGSCL